jgi:uncharacterized membrane protein
MKFWKNFARLSIYFVVASFFGHLLEIAVQGVIFLFTREWHAGILSQPLEPYPVYGLAIFGMVALWQVLSDKIRKNPLLLFIFLTGVCAVVEYVVGWLSAWRYGQNPFWNYSDKPFNLHGHICLQFTLMFGAGATVFMMLVFPRTEKLLDRLPKRALFIAAGVMWTVFWACQLAFGVK